MVKNVSAMTETKQQSEPAPKLHGKEAWWRYLLKYGIPLVVSAGLCYLLFTGVDFKEMVSIIRDNCNYWWIVLTFVISIFSHIFRGMRWGIQLRAVECVRRFSIWYCLFSDAMP